MTVNRITSFWFVHSYGFLQDVFFSFVPSKRDGLLFCNITMSFSLSNYPVCLTAWWTFLVFLRVHICIYTFLLRSTSTENLKLQHRESRLGDPPGHRGVRKVTVVRTESGRGHASTQVPTDRSLLWGPERDEFMSVHWFRTGLSPFDFKSHT